MKKFLLILIFIGSIGLLGCSQLSGVYVADKYGDEFCVVFEKNKTATVIMNGERFEANYFERNGAIEVWQNRKTPGVFLKILNKNELQLLDSAKTETDIILRKK